MEKAEDLEPWHLVLVLAGCRVLRHSCPLSESRFLVSKMGKTIPTPQDGSAPIFKIKLCNKPFQVRQAPGGGVQ